MKVVKKGSDFFNLYTTLNAIAALHSNDQRHSCFITLLQDHIGNARKEHEHYKTSLNECRGIADGGLQHDLYGFTGKVLFPKFLRQPRQLYLVTGLKFNIFGIHDNNARLTYVFGLPEGLGPNKTADTVTSMIHYVVQT